MDGPIPPPPPVFALQRPPSVLPASAGAFSCAQACARCALRFGGVRSAVYAVPPPSTAALCVAVADACSKTCSLVANGAGQPACTEVLPASGDCNQARDPARQEALGNGSPTAPTTAPAADYDATPSTADTPSALSEPMAMPGATVDNEAAAPAAPPAAEAAAPPPAASSGVSSEQQSAERPQNGGADAQICPLCLGILQAPDAPQPLRTGEAKIALPDMDASGGDWRLLPTGEIAAIAAAARHGTGLACGQTALGLRVEHQSFAVLLSARHPARACPRL